MTFTVTGVNPTTKNVNIQINSAGVATCTFQYSGLEVGIDTITATLPSHSLTSNQAKVAWSAYPAPVAVYGINVAVMSADGSGLFNGLTPVLSTTPVEGLMFNPIPMACSRAIRTRAATRRTRL